MIGVFVNVLAVIVGSLVGLVAKRFISDKLANVVMMAMGLVSVYIGIKGALVGNQAIIVLIAIVLGTIIGTVIDIDKYITLFGEFLKSKFMKEKNSEGSKFVDAFVTSSIFTCVGAMVVVGSIEAGLTHKYDVLFLKSAMDAVTSIMLTASMGIGVMFSAITILVVEGLLTIFSGTLNFLVENEAMLNETTCTGYILIIGLGLNLLGATKLKIANMAPAIVLAPIIYFIAMQFKLV